MLFVYSNIDLPIEGVLGPTGGENIIRLGKISHYTLQYMVDPDYTQLSSLGYQPLA
jgi:hypothetical protein